MTQRNATQRNGDNGRGGARNARHERWLSDATGSSSTMAQVVKEISTFFFFVLFSASPDKGGGTTA